MMILDLDKIYFEKTREYLREVISSYANGNYRSAVMMLYAVVMADLLYKLEDLKDNFGDSKAEEILEKIGKSKNGENNTKWECVLLDETKILVNEYTSQKLYEMKKIRNLSAHPIFNEEYNLIIPSKETVAGLIIDLYNGILTQAPLFLNKADQLSKKIVKELLASKKIYANNKEVLNGFITSRFLSHMKEEMKCKVFKDFWYYCFIGDDSDCSNNRRIFFNVLECIYISDSDSLCSYIKDNKNKFGISTKGDSLVKDLLKYNGIINTGSIIYSIISFISKYPAVYGVLEQNLISILETVCEKHAEIKMLFKLAITDLVQEENIEEIFGLLYQVESLQDQTLDILIKRFVNSGKLNELQRALIKYFGNSLSYKDGRYRFDFIKDMIKKFDKDQLEELIKVINENCDLNTNFQKDEWVEIIKSNTVYLNINVEKYGNFLKS